MISFSGNFLNNKFLTALLLTVERIFSSRLWICIQVRALPVAGYVDTWVFDKTGTITKADLDLRTLIPICRNAFQAALECTMESPWTWLNQLDLAFLAGLGSCHSCVQMPDGTMTGSPADVAMAKVSGWQLTSQDLPNNEDPGRQCYMPPTNTNGHPIEVCSQDIKRKSAISIHTFATPFRNFKVGLIATNGNFYCKRKGFSFVRPFVRPHFNHLGHFCTF